MSCGHQPQQSSLATTRQAPVFPPAGPESWSLMTTIRENPFFTSRVARGPPSPSPRVDDPTPWMTLVTALRWQPRTRCAAAVPRRCPRRAAPPPLLRELRPTADLKWPAGRLVNTRLPSTRRSCTTPKLRFTRSVVHFFRRSRSIFRSLSVCLRNWRPVLSIQSVSKA